MKNIIESYESQIHDALSIVCSTEFKSSSQSFNNILICGLGGSGIAGTVLGDILKFALSIPVLSCKDYNIPSFVNEKTLVIASSYSGNTEETLSAVNQALKLNAEICVVTSGGKLLEIANQYGLNSLVVPAGYPPRGMFNYSIIQLFGVLVKYKLIDDKYLDDFKKSVSVLNKNQTEIKEQAMLIANELDDKIPVIYANSGFEGVAMRTRQQLNENSKTLCWHNVIPEMNHNELLGWRTNTKNLMIINLKNHCDFYRNLKRQEIGSEVFKKFTNHIFDVCSKGNSMVENMMYLVCFGDWLSYFVAIKKQVDPVEMDILNIFKDKMLEI